MFRPIVRVSYPSLAIVRIQQDRRGAKELRRINISHVDKESNYSLEHFSAECSLLEIGQSG